MHCSTYFASAAWKFGSRGFLGADFGRRHELGISAEHDIRAAAGHVGRDGHGAEAAGLRNDFRFALVVLRVQHEMLDAGLFELVGDALGLLDRNRADQHRLPALVAVADFLDHGVELLVFGFVNDVVIVDADHRLIGRNHDHLEAVNFLELDRFRVGRAGHARQLLVHAEVVLERDGRERLVLGFDLDVLFRLDRLMQPVAPSPAGHQPPGEFIDDDHFAVFDDVIDVALEQRVRAQPLVRVMQQQNVARVVQVLDAEQLLDPRHAVLGERDGAHLLVDGVVLFGLEARDDAVDDVIGIGRLFRRARNNQRRARLVDQNRVDFVHDREVVLALNVVLDVELHVVAQVVEAELVVLAVGDVGAVGDLALLVGHAVNDDADRQTEEIVDAPHPFGVAPGQVIVDGHDVHAAARQRIEHCRQSRDESLALAGLHFGDSPLVQDHAADQLHVKVALADSALRGLAHDGEDRRQNLEHRLFALLAVFDCADLRLPFGDFGAQFVVAQRGDLGLEPVDLLDVGTEPFDFAFVLRAEDFSRYKGKS